MDIFKYRNYKDFTNDFIKLRSHKGRGQYLKIANTLDVHSTMISHVFKGDKSLTLEHGLKLSKYLGLTELEQEYFLCMIQEDRAGTQELKKHFSIQIDSILKRSKKISERLPTNKKLNEQDSAQFYSSWIYSAIRLLSSIEKYQDIDSLINFFDIPPRRAKEVIDFLLKTGLCKSAGDKITIGPTHLHLDRESSLIFRHHANWRQKAYDKHEILSDDELMFSSPLTISKKDISKIRDLALNFIQEVRKVVDESEPEELMCLNIDWFEVK